MAERDGAAASADYMARRAVSRDLDSIRHLYRQLNPDDLVLTDGSDAAAFDQILTSDGLTIFVLESDGAIVPTANDQPSIASAATTPSHGSAVLPVTASSFRTRTCRRSPR